MFVRKIFMAVAMLFSISACAIETNIPKINTIEELKAVAQSGEMAVLFFSQDSCGYCVRAMPMVEKLAKTHKVYYIDTDKVAPAIKQEFSIRATPTTVLIKGFDVLDTYSGYSIFKNEENLTHFKNTTLKYWAAH